MSNFIELMESENVPTNFKFLLGFHQETSKLSHFGIAKHIGLLDQYIEDSVDLGLLNNMTLEELCIQFPHLNMSKEKLSILKSGVPYFNGLYQLEINKEAYKYKDLYDYCTDVKSIVLNLNNKPIIFLPSENDYYQLQLDISSKNHSNEIVFWLDCAGLLPTTATEPSAPGTGIAIQEQVMANNYYIAIAPESEIVRNLSRIDSSVFSKVNEKLYEDQLPHQAEGCIEFLSFAEKHLIHKIHFNIIDSSINRVVCLNQMVTESFDWTSLGMYQGLKLFLQESGIPTKALNETPYSGFTVIEMLTSEHTDESFECGIKINTIPIPGGYTLTLDMMYTSEFEIETNQTSTPEIQEGIVQLSFGSIKQDPLGGMINSVREHLNEENGDTFLAYEDSFPIYLTDLVHTNLSGDINSLLSQFASSGMQFLIIGEISSEFIANTALIAAQNGFMVFGWVYSATESGALKKFTYKQSIYRQSEPHALGQLVRPIQIEHETSE